MELIQIFQGLDWIIILDTKVSLLPDQSLVMRKIRIVISSQNTEIWILDSFFFSFHNIYNALVENKTKEPNKYNPNCQWYVKKLHSKSVLWWSTVLYTSVFTWTVICSLTHLNFTFFQNQKLFELWAHL